MGASDAGAMKTWAHFSLLAATAWVSLTTSVAVHPQSYIVTDLGPGTANDINNYGQVVGQTDNGEAFVWGAGTLTILPSLVTGGWAEALAINNYGRIVGWSETSYGFAHDHGVLWEGGTAHDLGTLSGGYGHSSYASAINNAGLIVGYSDFRDQFGNNPRDRACVSDNGSTWVSLGTLPGASTYSSHAWAINESGVIGGESRDANFKELPCLWPDGTASSIQALSLPVGFQAAGWVNGLNDNADAVGAVESTSSQRRAVLWPSDQSPVNLGTLPGGDVSFAMDINNLGQVVGSSGYDYRAFIWEDGQMRDLNDRIAANSGWTLRFANSINDAGQIVGAGTLSGERHAFLLSPVKLIDAQAFQPSLDENGAPFLATPVTNRVESFFERVGSLTDGASLVVVQIGVPGMDLTGWTVSLVDPDNPSYGAAELGSLWNGDESSLPPLPATLSDPGTITATLGTDETAIFYRAAPSWAFGKETKEHDIEIQIFDSGNNLAAAVPFTLHKPPLVLVHGGLGDPNRWDNFEGILTNVGIVADSSTRADYSSISFSGLDVIYTAVPIAISNKISQLRSQDRVAATRLDVVAHSFGGVAVRWYMTPASERPTGQRVDESVQPLESGVFPLRFKTTPIHDDAQMEFRRADNFGVGDVRRLITLGTPHRGMTLWMTAIKFFNRAMEHKLERKRVEGMTGITLLEMKWNFRLIPLEEPGNPIDDQGMLMLDLAAFGLNGVGPVSRVLDGLPPVQVAYAPVEGVALDRRLDGDDLLALLFRFYTRFVTGGLPPPADTLLSNSDGIVPAASARNLNPVVSALRLEGINHIQLGNHRFDIAQGQLMEVLVGADEDLYYQP
jgi:probable HAF family extracellular repeat protein